MIVGLVLMLLVVFRPQGLFGKREELALRARVSPCSASAMSRSGSAGLLAVDSVTFDVG